MTVKEEKKMFNDGYAIVKDENTALCCNCFDDLQWDDANLDPYNYGSDGDTYEEYVECSSCGEDNIIKSSFL